MISDPQRPRTRWAGFALRWGIGILAAGLAINALLGRRDELAGAVDLLQHVRFGWVVVAMAAELASIVCFALLTRGLLATGGFEMPMVPLTGLTLAANAIQNSLPAGPAWSTVYAFRQFRRRGADPVLAGWTLAISTIVAFCALAFLALIGFAVADDQASSLSLGSVIVGVAVVSAALVLAGRRGLLSAPVRRLATGAIRLAQRLVRRPRGDASAMVNEGLARLVVYRPGKAGLARAGGAALGNWLLDLSALVLAFVAVRAQVPWRGLLLAYGAGQLAANLPLTLGGLGVVEGSLTVALVYYGGAQVSTVAAVLLYRIVSFWLLLPTGWAAALIIRLRSKHEDAESSADGASQEVAV